MASQLFARSASFALLAVCAAQSWLLMLSPACARAHRRYCALGAMALPCSETGRTSTDCRLTFVSPVAPSLCSLILSPLQVLKALGVESALTGATDIRAGGGGGRADTPRLLPVGEYTAIAMHAVSNGILSHVSERVLVVPTVPTSVPTVPTVSAVTASDLRLLPQHGRATAVEAAAAAVHSREGSAPLAPLARYLLASAKASALMGANWKGRLLERGGTVSCVQARVFAF